MKYYVDAVYSNDDIKQVYYGCKLMCIDYMEDNFNIDVPLILWEEDENGNAKIIDIM